ncbi:MAG: SPOR domain-containing protein, partial [Methyloprofundus sp.]|nr:SPOR domain-containing protein [Methyloprofundus sp.]
PVTVSAPPLIEKTVEPDKLDKLKEDEVLVEQASQVEVIKVELVKKAEDSVSVLNEQDDRKWVLAQQKQQYTLQLMSLSAKNKLLEEQEKYLQLGVKTFYLEKKVNQSRSYVLFYGVFASLAEAKKQMKKLPKELQKSWPRAFSAIQKDL